MKMNLVYKDTVLLRVFLTFLKEKHLLRALLHKKREKFTPTFTQLIPTLFRTLFPSEG